MSIASSPPWQHQNTLQILPNAASRTESPLNENHQSIKNTFLMIALIIKAMQNLLKTLFKIQKTNMKNISILFYFTLTSLKTFVFQDIFCSVIKFKFLLCQFQSYTWQCTLVQYFMSHLLMPVK